MHDLIQEMGKQIVREESPKNPGQRSRLCDPKEVCDVLKNSRGTEIVEAIFFDASEYTNISLSPKAFEKMLSLQKSNVERLWNGETNLPNLEKIDLTGSNKLIECPNMADLGGNKIPSSILNNKNVRIFYFPMIECLVDLPENFANHIYLGSPLNPENDSFITLHKVLSSPAFVSLKHLCLTDNPTLSEIPDNIFLLSSLESLILMDMAITSLPENIKYLPQLNQLNVLNCKKLQSIPALSQFIPFFIVLNCESLEKVLSSMCEACDKPNPCFSVLINCKKLDLHSYQTVLEDAIDGIEQRARLNSANEDDIIGYLLPDMPGREYWFHYHSTQVSFTIELPPNLLGFAYYFVLSQGHMKKSVNFGCECYLEYSSAERIYITSFTRSNSFIYDLSYSPLLHLMSDHVVLWYDPVSCQKIMEEIKAIKELNSTSYSPKLTFRFFIDEALHDGIGIKECGFRWIYQEEAAFQPFLNPKKKKRRRRRTSLELLS
ncbi:hypothetical protein P8452_73786 [Trifolium repens]|nr:hypothetical protein P8452_73786 [Trifolium repens]